MVGEDGLGMEFGIKINVETGGETAITELTKYTHKYQQLIDSTPLDLRIGVVAKDVDAAFENLQTKEDTAAEIARQKRLSRDGKILQQKSEFEVAMKAKQDAAYEAEFNALLKATEKEEAAYQKKIDMYTQMFMAKERMQERDDARALLSEQKQMEALQMLQAKKNISNQGSAFKNIYSAGEGSIDEIESKLQRLYNETSRAYTLMRGLGFDDAKLSGSIEKANSEFARLREKLQSLKNAFQGHSLDELLKINPSSIKEATVLMTELARRRQELNRNDAGYISNLTSINKKQSELSTRNSQDLALGSEKTKQIHAQNSAYESQSRVISNLKSVAFQYLSIYGAIRLVKSIAETTGMFELQRVSLTAIIHDGEKANEIFEKIKKLAVVSPFQFKDLVTYTKQLAAFRIETDQLFDTMKSLADVSAGLGVDMDRIILAYGQVSAASVLNGKTLRQFSQAGIPMVALLAEQFSKLEGRVVSTSEVFSKISQRLVPFRMVQQVFKDMTTEGGMFFNMQEIQAETLKGKISNLVDAYTIMFNDIGSGGHVNAGLKSGVDLLMQMFKHWEGIAEVIMPVVAGVGLYKGGLLAVSVAQKAHAAVTGASTLATNAATIANEREAKSIALKIAAGEANLIVNKSGIAADLTKTALAEYDVGLTGKQTAAYAVRKLVLAAGVDVQKLANLEEGIKNILLAKGIVEEEAASMAAVIYAGATRTATIETVAFGDAVKASFITAPYGWVIGVIAALITLGVVIYEVVSSNNALKNSLRDLHDEGVKQQGELTDKFKALSENILDSSKSVKEHEASLKTMNQVYKDILPTQLMTIEGLKALKSNYTSVTTAINEYIAAKTKEKQLDAVVKYSQDKIVPVENDLISKIQDTGASISDAKGAVAQFKKEITDGNLKGLDAVEIWNRLQRIVFDVSGKTLEMSKMHWYSDGLDNTLTKANELNVLLGNQKDSIAALDDKGASSYYGAYSLRMKQIKTEIDKTVGSMEQGRNSDGSTFRQSVGQFEDSKLEVSRKKYKEFLDTLQSHPANKGVVGYKKVIEELQKSLKELDSSPFKKFMDEIVQKASDASKNTSAFGSYFIGNRDTEEYLKEMKSEYDRVKKAIEEANAAKRDGFVYDTLQGNIIDKNGKEQKVTFDMSLNGYSQLIGNQLVYTDGLNAEFAVLDKINRSQGAIDFKPKKPKAIPVDPDIKALENEIALIDQAKKKYDELSLLSNLADAKKKVSDIYGTQHNKKESIALPLAFTDEDLLAALKLAKVRFSTMLKSDQAIAGVTLQITGLEVKIEANRMKLALEKVESQFNSDMKRINLFKSIFDASGGDFDLAGRVAKSFDGEGTTNIQSALRMAMEGVFSINKGFDTKTLFDANGNVNAPAAQAEINKQVEVSGKGTETTKMMQRQLDEVINFQEKEIAELLKGLEKYDGFEQKRTNIIRKGVAERNNINSLPDTSNEKKAELSLISSKKQLEELSKVNEEQFKNSRLWQESFGDLDKASVSTIGLLKSRLKEFITENSGKLSAEQIDTLTKKLTELDKRAGVIDIGGMLKAMFKKIDLADLKKKSDEANSLYKKLTGEQSVSAIKSENANDVVKNMETKGEDKTKPEEYSIALEVQKKSTIELTEANKKLANSKVALDIADGNLIDQSSAATKAMDDNIKSIGKDIGYLNDIKGGVSGVADAFYGVADAIGVAIDPTTKGIIDDITKSLGAAIGILGAVLAVIVAIAAITALVALGFAPLLIALAAIAAVIAIISINNTIIDGQIKTQADLIKDLQVQYDALGVSMKTALGADYIQAYNAQLDNMSKQVVAVQKQLDLEKSKGSSSDKDKIDEYTKTIASDQQAIIDKQNEFAAAMAGSDLTSMAKSFAQAWIEAYLSYANTTDAMTAKFKEMMVNMVVNSALSKLAQVALKDVYSLIDTLSADGSFSPADLAQISAGTTKAATDYNASATLFVDGLDKSTKDLMRSGSNLTGVSKGMAGVTEDTSLLIGSYLDSIRFKLFAFIDWKMSVPAFDLAGSMANLLVLHGAQISHLAEIQGNTLRSAIATERLTSQLDSVTSVTGSKGAFSINVNT